jgi:rhamnogalacturonan endolyase
MGGFKLLGLAALASSTFAAPLEERAKQPKSFFEEVGNSTWVIGNDVWNVTQNLQYANNLWYKGKDRVGQAVGHYVSYSKSWSHSLLPSAHQYLRWRGF